MFPQSALTLKGFSKKKPLSQINARLRLHVGHLLPFDTWLELIVEQQAMAAASRLTWACWSANKPYNNKLIMQQIRASGRMNKDLIWSLRWSKETLIFFNVWFWLCVWQVCWVSYHRTNVRSLSGRGSLLFAGRPGSASLGLWRHMSVSIPEDKKISWKHKAGKRLWQIDIVTCTLSFHKSPWWPLITDIIGNK